MRENSEIERVRRRGGEGEVTLPALTGSEESRAEEKQKTALEAFWLRASGEWGE